MMAALQLLTVDTGINVIVTNFAAARFGKPKRSTFAPSLVIELVAAVRRRAVKSGIFCSLCRGRASNLVITLQRLHRAQSDS